jgi:DNA polymerase-3 subunit delta'
MNRFYPLIGQVQAVELLQQAIAHNRVAPAYLFAGPLGVGKRLAAKAFAEELLAWNLSAEEQERVKKRFFAGNHPDLLWIEPTYQHQGKLLTAQEAESSGLKRKAPPLIRIEQVREINQFLSRPPLEAERAVIIIEEAQAMNEGAANALLKTLEEPGRATLILLAPSVDSLLPTLVSRCQRIPFYRLSEDDLELVLGRIGETAVLAYPELLAIAQGSPGAALYAYEQLQAIPFELRQQLNQVPQSPLEALNLAKAIDKNLDTQLQLWLIDYLQNRYWQSEKQQHLLEILEKARKHLTAYVQPRLVWECTLLSLVATQQKLVAQKS